MRLVLLALLLTGCVKQQLTPCGASLAPGSASWLTLRDLSQAEVSVLDAAEQLGIADRHAACTMLAGVEVHAREQRGLWEEPSEDGGDVLVDGTANCALLTINVGRPVPEDRWQFSSLSHELFHIVTKCDGHVGWSKRGVYQALVNIYFTAVPDDGGVR